jgi:hypothetical protein
MIPGGIQVIVGEEGIKTLFIASDGGEVELDALAVAGELDPDSARIMLQWCRDRLMDAVGADLPADVREGVEDKIAALAAQVDAKAAKRS